MTASIAHQAISQMFSWLYLDERLNLSHWLVFLELKPTLPFETRLKVIRQTLMKCNTLKGKQFMQPVSAHSLKGITQILNNEFHSTFHFNLREQRKKPLEIGLS